MFRSVLRHTEEVSGTLVSQLFEHKAAAKTKIVIGFDRDLGVAGRVMVRGKDGSIQQKLVKVDRPSMTPCLVRNSASDNN